MSEGNFGLCKKEPKSKGDFHGDGVSRSFLNGVPSNLERVEPRHLRIILSSKYMNQPKNQVRKGKTYMLQFSIISKLLSAVLVLFPAIVDKGIESTVNGGSDAVVFTLLSGLDPLLSGELSCISTSL